MEQNLSFKLEPLGRFKIYTSKNHTFGTDACILSHFAASKKVANSCDLGTGCGIIPLLMLKDGAVKRAVGVEIMPEGCQLAELSAKINKLEDLFQIINSDLKELKGKLPFGEFDLVTCNPPYKAENAGIKSKSEADKAARHETLCNFDDICLAASKLLKFSGSFCVCHRPERLSDIICSMRANKIEPKTFREVIQRKGKEPWLILVEGKKGAKAGMRILPPLFVEEDGAFSKEMLEIYGDYKENYI